MRRHGRARLLPLLGLVLAVAPRSARAQGPDTIGYTGKSTNDSAIAFDLVTGTGIGGDLSLLPEGDYPYDATLTPDGTEVWIVGAVGDGVVVLDRATGAIIQRIDLAGQAEYPVDVLFEPCRGRAFVSSRDSEVVAIVDRATYQVTGTVDLPGVIDGGKMAISGQRRTLYVADWYDDFLVTIDLDTLATGSVDIGTSLWDAAISPDETTLYVTDRGVDQVVVVDLDTLAVTTTVAVGDDPWGIDVTPDGTRVVVANEDSSSVTLFDTATLTPASVVLPSGSDPRDVEISADGTLAYVPSGDLVGDDAVFELDATTGALLRTILVGPGNTNVVAVRAQPESCGLFADGFESGDTGAWSSTVP